MERLEVVLVGTAVVPSDRLAARAYGDVVAGLRRVGRHERVRTLDLLIAATAVAHGLALYTVNPSDFVGIDGLELHALRHPDASG